MANMLGRNPSQYEIPKLTFKNYAAVLPAIPATADYSANAQKTLRDVYLNNQLGCCVISAGAHIRGVTSGNAGNEVSFTSPEIRKMYSYIGGGGDNGANPIDALRYWSNTGFTDGTKLMGWLAVDPADPVEYKTACWLFENLFYGVACPNAWFNPMPQRDGFRWDVAGNPVGRNGHSWCAVGYNEQGMLIDTWGMIGLMTDAAHARYCTRSAGGELYVMISPDMVGKGMQRAPNGLNWHDLIVDFNLLGGNLPVPPDLEPTPINWLI